MPNPNHVHCVRTFKTRTERDAYAEGLRQGANYLAQGDGSDPYAIRLDDDPIAGFSAYIEQPALTGNQHGTK